MAEPSRKSAGMESTLKAMFGRSSAITANVCVSCEQAVTKENIRDQLSWREYTISGLCQSCQDEVFGV